MPTLPLPRFHRTARHRAAVAAVLACVGLVAAACSSTLNVSTLERELASQIAVQQQVPASEVRVTCPESIEVAEGARTRCTATVAGNEVDVEVTQLDAEGTVEWVIDEPEQGEPESSGTESPPTS